MVLTASKATGTKVTFAGFTGKLIRIGGPNSSIEEIDATNLETEGWADIMEDDIKDPGEVDVDVEFDGSAPPLGTRGVLTITWGKTGRSWSCAEAFLKSFNPQAETRGKLTANAVFRCSGEITYV